MITFPAKDIFSNKRWFCTQHLPLLTLVDKDEDEDEEEDEKGDEDEGELILVVLVLLCAHIKGLSGLHCAGKVFEYYYII